MTTAHRRGRGGATAEPLAWLLFSAGGMVAALLIPVLLLLFGVAIPLGAVAAPEYDHLHAVLRHPLTVVVLIGLCALALLHAAHRFRFTLQHGLRLARGRGVIAVFCYGGAAAASIVAAYLLIRG
ncbi:fumarate reductase subunit FrdD [Rhodococcus sp. NPDC058514]|uniref:fumarate reductase subunit FrdD n=1 Tax=unclassified Rhodococcus (in: high G+C Gram-positive bacteria) TaxID=192944 RepID=UPI00366056EA